MGKFDKSDHPNRRGKGKSKKKSKGRMSYLRRQRYGFGGDAPSQEARVDEFGLKYGDYEPVGYQQGQGRRPRQNNYRGRGRGGAGRGGFGTQQVYRRREFLKPGMKGFLCTTARREAECVRDVYNILNEYSENDSSGPGVEEISNLGILKEDDGGLAVEQCDNQKGAEPELEPVEMDSGDQKESFVPAKLCVNVKQNDEPEQGPIKTEHAKEEIAGEDKEKESIKKPDEPEIKTENDTKPAEIEGENDKEKLFVMSKESSKQPDEPKNVLMKTEAIEEIESEEDDEEEDSEESEDEEEDIDKAIANEVKELKSARVARKFRAVDTGVRNVVFISTTIDDPTELAYRIFDDVATKQQIKSKSLLRFVPVEATCYTNSMDEVVSKVKDVLKKYLGSGYVSYKIVANVRHNNRFGKDELIRSLAETVFRQNPLSVVNLTNPQCTIVVEVLKTILCLGIVKDFERFRRYNLLESGMPPPPAKVQEATTAATSGGMSLADI